MNKRMTLLEVLFVLFLLTTLTTMGASSSQTLSKTIVLYRYGLDGSIIPVTTTLLGDDDGGEALLETCSKLLEQDTEIQNFIFNNTSLEVMSRVKSLGKGFHWKSPFSFRIPLTILFRYRLFDSIKLRYKLLGLNVIPRVVCNYPEDVNAKTEIIPLPFPARQQPNATIITGPHEVRVLGFVGYATWRGMNAQWFDTWQLSTGFDGYAVFVRCSNHTEL